MTAPIARYPAQNKRYGLSVGNGQQWVRRLGSFVAFVWSVLCWQIAVVGAELQVSVDGDARFLRSSVYRSLVVMLKDRGIVLLSKKQPAGVVRIWVKAGGQVVLRQASLKKQFSIPERYRTDDVRARAIVLFLELFQDMKQSKAALLPGHVASKNRVISAHPKPLMGKKSDLDPRYSMWLGSQKENHPRSLQETSSKPIIHSNQRRNRRIYRKSRRSANNRSTVAITKRRVVIRKKVKVKKVEVRKRWEQPLGSSRRTRSVKVADVAKARMKKPVVREVVAKKPVVREVVAKKPVARGIVVKKPVARGKRSSGVVGRVVAMGGVIGSAKKPEVSGRWLPMPRSERRWWLGLEVSGGGGLGLGVNESSGLQGVSGGRGWGQFSVVQGPRWRVVSWLTLRTSLEVGGVPLAGQPTALVVRPSVLVGALLPLHRVVRLHLELGGFGEFLAVQLDEGGASRWRGGLVASVRVDVVMNSWLTLFVAVSYLFSPYRAAFLRRGQMVLLWEHSQLDFFLGLRFQVY